uniref:ARAD1C37532p n=1 Tax=Blastobotrys adeninivorans TaxID=409370 RepID=A0A060T3I0_BLAAD
MTCPGDKPTSADDTHDESMSADNSKNSSSLTDISETEIPKEPEKKEQPTIQSHRGRPSSCVFVASLSAAHSDDHLSNSVMEHFQQWGKITLVKVLRDQVNRPYAFVQYTNDEDASAALAGAQNTTLNGRVIRCEPARVNRTLYVTPLNQNLANEKSVQSYLEQFGELEDLVHSAGGTFRRIGSNSWFAKFVYRDDAIRAYASLRLHNEWTAEWAQNLDHGPSTARSIDKQSIFIGQLDSRVTKEAIIERFSRHGTIVDCNLIVRDKRDNLRYSAQSFSFVKFDNERAAAAAVEQENHTIFMDKTIHVQYRELNHPVNSVVEPRLALAPPPINLPSRYAYPPQRIQAKHHSYPVTPHYMYRKNRWKTPLRYSYPNGPENPNEGGTPDHANTNTNAVTMNSDDSSDSPDSPTLQSRKASHETAKTDVQDVIVADEDNDDDDEDDEDEVHVETGHQQSTSTPHSSKKSVVVQTPVNASSNNGESSVAGYEPQDKERSQADNSHNNGPSSSRDGSAIVDSSHHQAKGPNAHSAPHSSPQTMGPHMFMPMEGYYPPPMSMMGAYPPGGYFYSPYDAMWLGAPGASTVPQTGAGNMPTPPPMAPSYFYSPFMMHTPMADSHKMPDGAESSNA